MNGWAYVPPILFNRRRDSGYGGEERETTNSAVATNVLITLIRQGYVLDKNRLINGQILDEDYFDHLVSELQEIRASERKFCQKITDIYATAVDYSVDSQITKEFFAAARNHLSKDEIREWDEIVTMYLDYATRQARRHIPMTMADWASKLGVFLQFNDEEILQNKGKVTAGNREIFRRKRI